MNKCSAYVGLDVHKDTIAVAVALPGREAPVYRGEIKNQRKSLLRLIRSLSPHAEVLSFCYEAGPCGYGVYREIIDTGHYCEVVAPSLMALVKKVVFEEGIISPPQSGIGTWR